MAGALLDAVVKQAARPIQGPVPANAEAVLFADHAEMLACLARDWLNGGVASRWWWQGLLRGTELNAVIPQVWIDATEHVPAALAELAASGDAVSFVRVLGGGVARTLLRKLLRVHALPWIEAALEKPAPANGPAIGHADDAPSVAPPFAAPAPQFAAPAPTPPWQRWVPEANETGLVATQQCLFGIVMMFQRAPHVLRSVAFANDVERWHHATAAHAPVPFYHALREAPPRADEWRQSDRIDSPTPALTEQPPDRQRMPCDEVARNRPSLADETAHAVDTTAVEPTILRLDPAHANDAVLESGGPRPATAAPLPESNRFLHAVTIETELGGLFYLINLGLFLELYGDFTTPARPGLAMSIWDFVFLIGRRLLQAERATDAVWDLLARLSGRDADTPPGCGFEPADVWRLPAEWLRPFPHADAWFCYASADRLRVCHPAGFCVLDVPCIEAEEREQLAEEAKPYGGTDFQFVHSQGGRIQNPSHDIEQPPLDRWLDWLVPYVRARLCRALGLDDANSVGELLFVHRARVRVTATHLDVTLSLAELPCAIRLAGLDRDPGWVPAGGRFVTFHFG